MKDIVLGMAQMPFWVGEIEKNTDKVLLEAQRAQQQGIDLLLFPELTLTGYPPEDLLYRDDLYRRVEAARQKLCEQMPDIAMVVGFPLREHGHLYNAIGWFEGGCCRAIYRKQHLPNYRVFDEKRYFARGDEHCIVDFKGRRVGLLICEDLWFPGPARRARDAGADVILVPNASPYHTRKQLMRESVFAARSKETGLPMAYVNHVCGQDELLFDGQSILFNGDASRAYRAPAFQEQIIVATLTGDRWRLGQEEAETVSPEAEIYAGLVLGVRDYVNRNGFSGVVIGLSGGIDSALTLAIAVDALGAERVQAVMMPFRYTSQMSQSDAAQQAETMGVEYSVVSIEPIFDAYMTQLGPVFGADNQVDTTEENLQARARGMILMAISNKRRRMVLTTGNKSEMAVGYATLYGDMCGGFAVLKDVPKTLVFRLASYRNTVAPCIPERVITRPPSAELAPDQVDEDSLPPYPVLDRMIERYVEEDASVMDLIAEGFAEEDVRRVIRLIDLNEYKRRQSAVGPKITPRSFAKDRRYPITSGFGRNNG